MSAHSREPSNQTLTGRGQNLSAQSESQSKSFWRQFSAPKPKHPTDWRTFGLMVLASGLISVLLILPPPWSTRDVSKQSFTLLPQTVGLFAVVTLVLYFLLRYLHHQSKHDQKARRDFVLISCAYVGFLLVTKLLLFSFNALSQSFAEAPFNDPTSFYLAMPYAAGGVLIALLINANIALVFSALFSAFIGLMSHSTTLSIYSLAGAIAAIYAITHYRDRSAILKAGLVIALANIGMILALAFLGTRWNGWRGLLFDTANAVAGGIIVAALVSLLLPAFEALFEICTDIRLLELSNLNLPILRRLAAEAPGTYHHSIMVGTLAEGAAELVGANPLLVRVASLYHDIGKIAKPEYFIENSPAAISRHDQLEPTASSLIIIDHVKNGLELAKEIHLPQRVRDMIPQHHGTSVVTYFYSKAKNGAEPELGDVNDERFRYPGPRPQSKEAAIIMLADSIEAASRTLEGPTPVKLQHVVERLVKKYMDDHQLDECDLTLKELEKIKQAFVRLLTSIYHHRVPYPGFDFNEPVTEVGTHS